jgi:SAM-dependent methyltransferase
VLRSHRWRTVETSAAYLIPHLKPGLELLDVGCGPGTITADFAKRLGSGHVRGIDISADGIDAARRDHPGVDFATGDLYTMEFEDSSWDIVHAHRVLQHLSDPVAALKEMLRVVRLELYHEIARANGGGRLQSRRDIGFGLVLRDASRSRLVGRPVGRSDDLVRDRAAGAAGRSIERGRTGVDCGCLAHVGER